MPGNISDGVSLKTLSIPEDDCIGGVTKRMVPKKEQCSNIPMDRRLSGGDSSRSILSRSLKVGGQYPSYVVEEWGSSMIHQENGTLKWWWWQNVIQTQKCELCQLKKLSTPFPAGGFLPDIASSTRSKAQTWPSFNHHAVDNKGWVQHHS